MYLGIRVQLSFYSDFSSNPKSSATLVAIILKTKWGVSQSKES